MSSVGPEMISGVRASSTRIESTSSTIAKLNGLWTICLARIFHVVAQIIEAELIVGPVGDIANCKRRGVFVREVRHDDPGSSPGNDRSAHPFRVTPGEIIVDGDDMDALALERFPINRERRDKGLAFAGLISAICREKRDPPISCTS